MFRLGLHHLETLFWIDRLGSFAAAAERLNTTQSGISSRVRELEARLKTRVFQKEGRRMLLTLRGRDLVRRCEPLLQQVNGVLLSVSDEAYATGTVRLGLGTCVRASQRSEGEISSGLDGCNGFIQLTPIQERHRGTKIQACFRCSHCA